MTRLAPSAWPLPDNRSELFDRSAIRWLILAGGIASVLYVIKTRQPPTTSDFTIFYQSSAGPAENMYKGFRVNLNPPHFSLLIEPLTWVRMSIAAEIWRALNVLSLCGCLWWLATRSDEKWSAADVGAVLAWAPFHHAFTLNQVTWIMWPLLIGAWWQWRRDRWIAGAICFGVALSFKSFLGVFLLWLVCRRQWRAIAAAVATAGAALAVGIVAYGFEVFRAWVRAVSGVSWTSAWTNASLRALLLRSFTENTSGAAPFANIPGIVSPLFVALALTIVLGTCWVCRNRSVDDSWPALVASALLASPLGWLYYRVVDAAGRQTITPAGTESAALDSHDLPHPRPTEPMGDDHICLVFNWGLLFAWVGFIVLPGGSKAVSSPPERAVHDAPRAAP